MQFIELHVSSQFYCSKRFVQDTLWVVDSIFTIKWLVQIKKIMWKHGFLMISYNFSTLFSLIFPFNCKIVMHKAKQKCKVSLDSEMYRWQWFVFWNQFILIEFSMEFLIFLVLFFCFRFVRYFVNASVFNFRKKLFWVSFLTRVISVCTNTCMLYYRYDM